MKKLPAILITLVVLFNVYSANAFAKEKFRDGETNWSTDKVKRYIYKVWADRGSKEQKKAYAVFRAESGLSCKKSSKTNDIGVAQINKVHWKRFGGKDRLKSCKQNIDAAKIIYKEWGNSFRPWSAYKYGSYKAFL